jgi:hypothetical protein
MLDIDAIDSSWVLQDATDQYTIHQYKDYVIGNSITLTWIGQTNIAPSQSNVVLEIYKVNGDGSPVWEERDRKSDGLANVDFLLTDSISNISDYKNPSGIVTCRVYQYAGLE